MRLFEIALSVRGIILNLCTPTIIRCCSFPNAGGFVNHTTNQPASIRSNRNRLGKLEVGVGILFLVYVALDSMFGHLAPTPELPFFSGLSIFISMFTAATLLMAGGGLLKPVRWPFVWHTPLVLWLLIVFLAAL